MGLTFSGVTDYLVISDPDNLQTSQKTLYVLKSFKKKPAIVKFDWLIDSMILG